MPSMQALGAGFMAPVMNYTCLLPDGGDLQEALQDSQILPRLESDDRLGNVALPQNEYISLSSR